MGDITGISWTDHTFNPWWGCTRVAPGCDNCYAATLDKRTGGNYWDSKTQPRLTGKSNWAKPRKWNEQAEIEGRRHRVFCGSMMDWCDNQAPEGARDSLWQLIRETPNLDWQLLTKRAPNIRKCLPDDWGDGYHNVWLGVTAEDRVNGIPRILALREIPAQVRFVSAEPLLEGITPVDLTGIHWLIIGGESGPGFREMQESWATTLRRECAEQGVACWFKQWGGRVADKGGCLLRGNEVKEWPREALGLR